jgi:subtilisin family serine protease
VAGVVAAAADNGVGGAGLAQGARILPVRALGADGGGYGSNVAKGISWAVDHGARVVNLSLGGDRPSSLVTTAIQYALARGVTVVAASGNAGGSGDPVLYPAATRGVIAVGAVDRADQRPGWSSSGSHLALVAPGVGILSTFPVAATPPGDGTSMAAPFVSAAAALLLAAEPRLGARRGTGAPDGHRPRPRPRRPRQPHRRRARRRRGGPRRPPP